MSESETAAALHAYTSEGWAVVPVKREDKNPTAKGWPERSAARDFSAHDFADRNVGVVLGPVSNGLVDIDLDSQAAIELAPYFLPETLTFGRKSKRASHWLYYSEGVRSDVFKFGPKPRKGTEDKREQVEIRAQNKSGDACGHQSVFPGSVHTSGERIEWDNEQDVTKIEAGDLAWRVARLAVAAALLPDWAEGSHRNAKSFGVAGGLLKMGWKADEVRELLAAVRDCSGYDREEDASAVERTIDAFEEGREVTGLGQLALDGELDEHVVKSLERNARTPTQRAIEADLAKSKLGDNGLRAELLEEARAVDGMVDAANAAAELTEREEKRAPRKRAPRADDDPFKNLGRLVDLTVIPAPMRYLCPALKIGPGKVSALSGYAGTSKGPTATLFALCVASGRPFLGFDVKRERVAYFDFETGPKAVERFHRIARGLGLDLAELQRDRWIKFIDAGGRCIDDAWIDDCGELIEGLDAGLVVVDSYTSAVPGESNETSFADRAWEMGALSNELDTTFLVVFHEKKDEKTVGLRKVAGTQALAAAQQTTISATRPDEKRPSVIELTCLRADDEGFPPFTFEWSDIEAPRASVGTLIKGGNPNKWGLKAEPINVERSSKGQYAEAGEQERAEEIAQRIVSYVQKATVTTPSKIKKAVRGRDAFVLSIVQSLVEDGVLLEEPQPGTRGDLVQLAQPSKQNFQARQRWGVSHLMQKELTRGPASITTNSGQ